MNGVDLPAPVRFDDRLLEIDFGAWQGLTRLEIANIGRIALLEVIENGHTIDLASDGFNDKYDLEGSAKAVNFCPVFNKKKVKSCQTLPF